MLWINRNTCRAVCHCLQAVSLVELFLNSIFSNVNGCGRRREFSGGMPKPAAAGAGMFRAGDERSLGPWPSLLRVPDTISALPLRFFENSCCWWINESLLAAGLWKMRP